MSDKPEDYPVHEELDVVDGQTIYHNDDWWKAVVAYESWNGNEVAVYLWQKQDGQWRRKQKFKVDDQQEWTAVREAVNDMVDEHI